MGIVTAMTGADQRQRHAQIGKGLSQIHVVRQRRWQDDAVDPVQPHPLGKGGSVLEWRALFDDQLGIVLACFFKHCDQQRAEIGRAGIAVEQGNPALAPAGKAAGI